MARHADGARRTGTGKFTTELRDCVLSKCDGSCLKGSSRKKVTSTKPVIALKKAKRALSKEPQEPGPQASESNPAPLDLTAVCTGRLM